MLIHMEHSSDDSSYVDITGGAFSKVYADAGSSQTILLNSDELRQYLRAVKTLVGTSGSFSLSCNLIGFKQIWG